MRIYFWELDKIFYDFNLIKANKFKQNFILFKDLFENYKYFKKIILQKHYKADKEFVKWSEFVKKIKKFLNSLSSETRKFIEDVFILHKGYQEIYYSKYEYYSKLNKIFLGWTTFLKNQEIQLNIHCDLNLQPEL